MRCPFCRGTNTTRVIPENRAKEFYCVICDHCQSIGPRRKSAASAEEAWKRSTDHDRVSRELSRELAYIQERLKRFGERIRKLREQS